MDKVINCLFAAITLLLSARGEVFKGKEDYLEMFVRTQHMRGLVLRHSRGMKWKLKALKLSLPTILSDSLVANFRL